MSTSTEQHHYPISSNTGRWTLISTITASSMAFIDGTALNVILPTLQNELEATGSDLFWVLNSYLLMLAALIILGGSLGDKRGRVKIFQIGIFVFTIGSVLCGLSQSIFQLIVFRAVQGIGGALMIPGSLSIISATFTPAEKGKAIGLWSAATTIVTICGPILGGALADIGLWRGIFYINIPLGLLAMFILHFKVPESKDPQQSAVDWLGAGAMVFGLGSFTYGLLEMPESGWTNPLVMGSLIVGILALIAFVIIEQRVKNPMVPFEIFSNRIFSGVNILSFFLYAALGGAILFLPLNMVQIQGYTQFQAGLTFLPFSLLMVSLASVAGKLTDKYGPRYFLIFGPTITGLGFLLLAFVGKTAGPSAYWQTFFPGIFTFALGMAITVVPLTTAVMNSVDENQSGIASGINNSVTRISGTFMNAVVGAMAVFLFLQFVEGATEGFDFGSEVKAEVLLEARNLGDAVVPELVPAQFAEKVDSIYERGFINIYRVITMFCAGLAFLSALVAVFTVREPRD